MLQWSLALKDLGQAVIVADGEVIAEEGEKGTESLIKACRVWSFGKCKKPQQDNAY